jgi:hypothetical protein
MMELHWLIERCIETSDKDNKKGKYCFSNGLQIGDLFENWETPSWATNGKRAYYYFSPIRRLKALGVSGDLEELDKAIHELCILRESINRG